MPPLSLLNFILFFFCPISIFLWRSLSHPFHLHSPASSAPSVTAIIGKSQINNKSNSVCILWQGWAQKVWRNSIQRKKAPIFPFLFSGLEWKKRICLQGAFGKTQHWQRVDKWMHGKTLKETVQYSHAEIFCSHHYLFIYMFVRIYIYIPMEFLVPHKGELLLLWRTSLAKIINIESCYLQYVPI